MIGDQNCGSETCGDCWCKKDAKGEEMKINVPANLAVIAVALVLWIWRRGPATATALVSR